MLVFFLCKLTTDAGAQLYTNKDVVVTGVGTYGERVEREPITRVWGQSPQRGPAGAEPMVGIRGAMPPESERF